MALEAVSDERDLGDVHVHIQVRGWKRLNKAIFGNARFIFHPGTTYHLEPPTRSNSTPSRLRYVNFSH